jgi:ATP-dependent helicase/nuclease subunit A
MTPAYFHNQQSISAEAFYAIACDPRRSVAVEACAGAGKTWMLVSRMLRALLESDKDGNQVQAHEILAITFTKKAAGEMRERLYEWLEQFAHADDETLRQELVLRGVLSQVSRESSPQLRELLSNLYQRMLDNGRPVQIRTFHSWFAALLRSAPMAALQQLGLPLNYELLEDDGPAKALVWRRFYAALVADPLLKADFEAVVMGHGRFQAEKALQAALDKRTEFALADAQGVVDRSVQHFSERFPALAGFDAPERALAGDAVRAHWLVRARALASEKNKTPQKAAQSIIAAFETDDLLGRFTVLRKAFFVASDDRLTHNLVKFASASDAEAELLPLCRALTQHQAWTWQQRMARLSRLLLAEFTALKRERGWVDMNDVERAALVMLSDPVLAGWVQERLDARIRHLMIDEFQDTNPLQWQALYAWLSGYGGAGRAPGVFIVGDPKQSIYRFRRAEPQVFMAAQAFVRDGLGGDLLACDHTRRNSLAVINTVNAVMGAARDNDAYDGFRDHSSASTQAGSVQRLPAITRDTRQKPGLHLANDLAAADQWRDSLTTPRELPEETLRTLEVRQAAAWIAGQISSGLKPSDVMALSRKRACLMPLQVELRALGIPAQIGEKTSLIDCCEVQDIVALLDVLVSPQHDLSLARALRSPLFNVSSESLVQLALMRGQSTRSWFDLLEKEGQISAELQTIGPILIKYQDLVNSLPPHDALQAIFQAGDVLARFAAAAPATSRSTVLANLNALPGAALQLDGGRYSTPYAFVRALKAGGLQAPAAVNPDAVRLLTVHGAKGLEADAVLILDTDTVERNLESMSVLVDWPGEATAPQKFVFLVSESRPPFCAEAALAAEQAAREREELNGLYVALTRARNTLVLSSIEPHRATTASWWLRLYELAAEIGVPLQAAVAQDGPSPVEGNTDAIAPGFFALPDLPPFAAPDQVDASAADPAKPDSAAVLVGKAMHRLLEWGAGAPDWPADKQQRAANAVAREFGLSAAQLAQAASCAARIRQGEGAWAWQAEVIEWQGNEVELVCDGQLRRLDRLVRRKDAGHEGHWWVLDFKSPGRPQDQPELLAQMQGYRAALQAIYPDDIVKTAFLTGEGTLIEV